MNGFNKIVATGGIGTGMLFLSPIAETLGRSESRLVNLSGAKDYCKLHIVMHYVAAICGGSAQVFPVGFVGDDQAGESLLEEMRNVGITTTCVSKSLSLPTMVSICLQYPDKDGCNISAINSAANEVTPAYVLSCMEQIGIDKNTIVVALPEVPVDARMALLNYGKEHNAFCISSVPRAEAAKCYFDGMFSLCDLVAVNEDEASAIIGEPSEPSQISDNLYRLLSKNNPDIKLLVTMGKDGGSSVENGHVEHIPALHSHVVNTTGAGDACLGGIISGLIIGLPFQKGHNDSHFGQTAIESSVELGMLCSGLAIESEDSIAQNVTTENIGTRIDEYGWPVSAVFEAKILRKRIN